ncbi:MAG: Mur ligase family protein [Puniceicoccaceae bacterium]
MSLAENIPEHYLELLKKPVAILGVGASGKAVASLLDKLDVLYVVYDEKSGDEGRVERAFDRKDAMRHDLVIHSPAFQLQHPWIETALGQGCCVVSEMDFAQQLRNGPTILVIGTNGKTTLQEFITFSLKRTGISSMATGKNAYPLSRLAVHQDLDGVTAVCELGPDHIKPLKEFRFDTLFWTNFHEDHLDDPVEKKKIFEDFRRLLDLSPEADIYVGDSVVQAAEELEIALPDTVRLPREEDYVNWELPNTSAFATSIHRPALALFRRYWLEHEYADSMLKSAAEHFEVRAHRLHVTTIIGKTVFWNDANAGNFAATKAAIDHFDKKVVWIGGGYFRGGNLKQFVESFRDNLKGVVMTGNAACHVIPVLEELKVPCSAAIDLRQAVDTAFNMAEGEAPVVFSPGFIPGHDYDDQVERGICFENAVLGLKHQKGSV